MVRSSEDRNKDELTCSALKYEEPTRAMQLDVSAVSDNTPVTVTVGKAPYVILTSVCLCSTQISPVPSTGAVIGLTGASFLC